MHVTHYVAHARDMYVNWAVSPASLMSKADCNAVLMTDQEVGIAECNERVQTLMDRQLLRVKIETCVINLRKNKRCCQKDQQAIVAYLGWLATTGMDQTTLPSEKPLPTWNSAGRRR